MMNIHQDIHGTYKVRAVRFNQKNSNSVTIQIDTEGGVLEQTLYFGYDEAAKGRAAELFYALRGAPADVVGSKSEHEATIAKDKIVMNFPPPLLKIVENTIHNLPDDESETFTAAINAAAEGKDLSVVHWQILSAELRALPKLMPKDIQALIDQLIEGLDLFTEGKWWTDIFTTLDKIEIMFCKEWVSIAPHVQSAIYALKNVTDAIGAEDEDLEYTDAVCTAAVAVTNVADAAYHAAYDKSFDVETQKAAQADEDFAKLSVQTATDKATTAYAEARQRQRDTLLALIESAPDE